MENSFVKTPQEVCSYFGVDPSKGLQKGQIKNLQEKYGKNAVVIFLEVDFETVTNRLKQRGDETKRLLSRINSDEFKRDLQIPSELSGKCYKISNKNLENTKENVNKVLKLEKIK